MPTNENFKQVEVEVPESRDGEFLVRNIWMSVDPYMRGRMTERKSYVAPFELGKALEGGCVGKVVESKNNQFAVGDYVLGMKGWREYWISAGNPASGISKIDPNRGPIQLFLGIFGMTGLTAYVGPLRIGQLKEGETVFVSASATPQSLLSPLAINHWSLWYLRSAIFCILQMIRSSLSFVRFPNGDDTT